MLVLSSSRLSSVNREEATGCKAAYVLAGVRGAA